MAAGNDLIMSKPPISALSPLSGFQEKYSLFKGDLKKIPNNSSTGYFLLISSLYHNWHFQNTERKEGLQEIVIPRNPAFC